MGIYLVHHHRGDCVDLISIFWESGMSKYVISASYCQHCEEASKEIEDLKKRLEFSEAVIAGNNVLVSENEELQRQNAMMRDNITELRADKVRSEDAIKNMECALISTSAQSAAWLEASHIEWLKGLEPVGEIDCVDHSLAHCLQPLGSLPIGTKLYAIPTKKD